MIFPWICGFVVLLFSHCTIGDQHFTKCPRDCLCDFTDSKATCRTLEPGTQIFDERITQLIVEGIDPSTRINLENGIFEKVGLKNLQLLKIVNTTISSIEKRAFKNMLDLRSVQLISANIESIHPDTFIDNIMLDKLSLANNPFKETTLYLLDSDKIGELILSNCKLSKITKSTFSNLPGLDYINLSGNQITEIHPHSFENIESLEELDLSNNLITKLPEKLFANQTLATLNLHNNPISSVANLKLPDLEILDVSMCKIQTIPSTMFKEMSNLDSLNISSNGLRKIDDNAFKHLKELELIDLSHNNLLFVPSQLFSTNTRLSKIDLSHNYLLKELPKFEAKGGSLTVQHMDFSYCNIESINSDAFETFPFIETLTLNNNQIQHIDDKVFYNLKVLSKLNLAHNKISQIHIDLFSNNHNLHTLILANNPLKQISVLPFSLTKTPALESLDISSCGLEELWETPHILQFYLTNLKFLNVSENNIKSIKKEQLQFLTSLTTINVANNPLEYNSKEFSMFKDWVHERNIALGEPELTHMEIEEEKVNILPSSTTEEQLKLTTKSYEIQKTTILDIAEDDDEDDDYEDDDDEDLDENDNPKYTHSFKLDANYRDAEASTFWIVTTIALAFFSLVILVSILALYQQQRSGNMTSNLRSSTVRTRKDCGLVYKPLSEDLSGPHTPIFSRFVKLNSYNEPKPEHV